MASPQMKFQNIQLSLTGSYILGTPESKTFDYTTRPLCWTFVFQGIKWTVIREI